LDADFSEIVFVIRGFLNKVLSRNVSLSAPSPLHGGLIFWKITQVSLVKDEYSAGRTLIHILYMSPKFDHHQYTETMMDKSTIVTLN